MISLPQTYFFYCFSGALITYAILGSPTPDNFSWVECIIALLLCLSIRVDIDNPQNKWPLMALSYGLSIPMVIGAIYGHSLIDILRDAIPFLFLFLPLMYRWMSDEYPLRLIQGVVGVGIIFSLRTLISYREILESPMLWGQGPPADLLYLANSPEVLFSALFCIGYGFIKIIKETEVPKGLIILALSLFPVLAMVMMMQRAGLSVVAIYTVSILSVLFYQFPKKAIVIIGVLICICAPLIPVFENVFALLWKKTEIVGLNTRSQEWGAVFDVLTKTPQNFLFGEGWGARFENPAVGGLNVNFTHSLISSLLLKAGFIGLVVILLGSFLVPLRGIITNWKNMKLFELSVLFAAFFPFLIAIALYASYKSLGFGLILLIFLLSPLRKLEKNQ